MATKIRLARGGRKSSAHYSIVVIESHRKQTGKFIERIGHYHPLRAEDDSTRIVLDSERAKYWLSVGAIPTEIVIKFMKKLKVEIGEKYNVTKANPLYIGKSKETIALEKKVAKDAQAAAKKAKAEEAKKIASEVASERNN